jgi:hypothetical protein
MGFFMILMRWLINIPEVGDFGKKIISTIEVLDCIDDLIVRTVETRFLCTVIKLAQKEYGLDIAILPQTSRLGKDK